MYVCRHCLVEERENQDTELSHGHSYRKVLLHTLLHGFVEVYVTDFICRHCSRMNNFDGADLAIFSASEKTVYMRELLDFWLYHVACIGGTFREAYEISMCLSRCVSKRLITGGAEHKTRRRSASNCFAAFPKTLHVPEKSNLTNLFTCRTCEDRDGRLCGIAMDITAAGVLGELPKFVRPAVALPPTKNCATAQYLLPKASQKNYVDALCRCARTAKGTSVFSINCGGHMESHVSAAEEISSAPRIERKKYFVGSFISQILQEIPHARSERSGTSNANDQNSKDGTINGV